MKPVSNLKAALLVTLLIAAQGASPAQQVHTSSTAATQLAAAIHDYILAHPEVVLQSVHDFDTRNKERNKEVEKQKIRDLVRAQQEELTLDSVSQKATASSLPTVTVVEFFDYRCGYCKKVAYGHTTTIRRS